MLGLPADAVNREGITAIGFEEEVEAIDQAGANGLYVILDMHQDAWSKYIFTPEGTDSATTTRLSPGWRAKSDPGLVNVVPSRAVIRDANRVAGTGRAAAATLDAPGYQADPAMLGGERVQQQAGLAVGPLVQDVTGMELDLHGGLQRRVNPISPSDFSSMVQFLRTLTQVSRYTCLPNMSSMSRRAASPTAFRTSPLLPTTMPL